MRKLIAGALALFLFVFFLACDNPSNGNGPSAPPLRVGLPSITSTPTRSYNNAPVVITFSSATSGAVFYYTLNGDTPVPGTSIRYDGPFTLMPGNENISDTPRLGHIEVRVIGVREGMTNSFVQSHSFQIFETVSASYWSNQTTAVFYGVGTGYYGGVMRVGIRLVDGVIDHAGATIQSGYGGTPPDTGSDFNHAVSHARAFWALMNHWDFDARTGATGSSGGIRTATRQALVNAGVIVE